MPVKRFFIITLITSAIYTPIVFLIVKLLGDIVLYKLGYWAWGILLLFVVLFPLRKAFRKYKKGRSETTAATLTLPRPMLFNEKNGNFKKQLLGMPSLNGVKHLINP